MHSKRYIWLLFLVTVVLYLQLANANTYIADIYFTVPDTVYITNERIELKGYLFQANYSDNGTLISASTALANANVNITITNKNSGALTSNYTFRTDSTGLFYSASNYYTNATNITAPSSAEDYYIRAQYIDPNNTIWFSQVEITVVNQTIDMLRVSSEKAVYSPSETVGVEAEAIHIIGDRILYKSNVSINGTLRNSTKTILESFSCTTGANGKCTTSVTAPSSYGNYILELNNFKAFGSFSVTPFFFSIYMKDELGQSLKNVYSLREQGRVEVRIANASSTDSYAFSGYIADSAGNAVDTISSTILNNNNSFINSFLFTIDPLKYNYGAYNAFITVTKIGDGSISASTSFEVKDWTLSMDKKSTGSGFEYKYSIFPNKTMNLEIYPKYRTNGSVIGSINSTFFTINLKDNLNNIFSSANVSWNASCGTEGCYEFSLQSPLNTGQYNLLVSLSYEGVLQTKNRIINVINSVMTAQSTNKDGDIKELFGTNEYAYISLTAYNLTSSLFNLSNAEVFSIEYMNGSEFSYIQVNNFGLVNSSNSAYEWAWNSTSQRLKLDVPKVGGIYDVFIFANNRTVGAPAKFIVNPYEVCSVPKDTAGTVTAGSSYYVWQFKTSDTVYFELKMIQADNPLGRASFSNFSSGNGSGTYGMGSQCTISSTQQAVSNASVSIIEVKNTESGALQNINLTASTCQASDSSGGYTCTVKPLSKWDGGVNIVKFSILGQDGTFDMDYGRFEARAFYLYGWSQNWQNSPSNNISLNVRLYEAGSGWWGSSGGLSGTITLKRVEYQGRDGEWIWPPVDSGYNVTNVTTSITSGSGTLSLPSSKASGGIWKTGYYRAVIEGTTANGDVDYGYAWFGIKLWDVYGQPIECTTTGCNYKSYFNSKENITLYVKISTAGNYNYYDQGGTDIYGNVTVGIKKIEDCRTWPCKELNSTQYAANTINVNASSPWYWGASLNNSKYLIYINKTSGTWGTGYYSVVLNVNGTDTGYAWFNTIAFYADTRPTDINGTNWKYSIKPQETMYYNVTVTKNYKGWGVSYNDSDYVNATIDDVVLRVWDSTTYQSKEYNYPENINVTIVNKTNLLITSNALVNLSYNNGSWSTGYYWGELTLRNSDNETATGYLWFEARPFRVSTSTNTYSIDSDQCVNTTINIYEPSWYSSTPLTGNYSIQRIYEDIWSGNSRSQISYANYTNSSFNGTTNILVCPNNGGWGGGSWGGYHYLNIVVKDNLLNNTESGWLSFRAVPFQVSWSGVSGGNNKLTNERVIVPVTLTKYSTGQNTTGNLTKIYQWRYDGGYNGEQEYVFSVGNCYSNVSGQCIVNGTQNITIYAPSTGWRVGYNYLYAVWSKQDDASLKVQDWSGIYIEGREAYNGYYSNTDSNGNWKYNFALNENLTIKLFVRDSSYNSIDVNITSVQYAYSGGNCWSEWCLSYTSATWNLVGGGVQTTNGNAVINLQAPSSNWTRGYYYIRASISGSSGTATITGGQLRIKDTTAPNITITSPVNNQTINSSTFTINATTSENSQCYFYVANYNNFNSWYCGDINSGNSTNSSLASSQKIGACNTTKYGYNGSSYYTEYVSSNYRSTWDSVTSTWFSGSTSLVTGGTTHGYNFNITNWTAQHYGIQIWCYDNEDNYAAEYVTIKVNVTTNASSSSANDTTPPVVTINLPASAGINLSSSSVNFNVTLNENGSCMYSLNSGTTNLTMTNNENRDFNATNASIADGAYTVRYYCNDTTGNANNTASRVFGIDTIFPLVSYGIGTPADRANLTANSIYVNVSVTETNFANITFLLKNNTGTVNSTTYTSITLFINWTGLAYTNYSYNVSIYDLVGHFNSTVTRYVNLSAA